MALSRRKYAELVRFFKSTMSNERMSHRVRMSAAVRLDDILARHELAAQHDAARKERSDVRALALQSLGGATGALVAPSQVTDPPANAEPAPTAEKAMSVHLANLLAGAGMETKTDVNAN
jgi:hypothetical protein